VPDRKCTVPNCEKEAMKIGEAYYPACEEHWQKAEINIIGPIQKGYVVCSCGVYPDIYWISGIGENGPRYWLCPNCGCYEVVVGSPLQFGRGVYLEVRDSD
jgi:hypothetical protein